MTSVFVVHVTHFIHGHSWTNPFRFRSETFRKWCSNCSFLGLPLSRANWTWKPRILSLVYSLERDTFCFVTWIMLPSIGTIEILDHQDHKCNWCNWWQKMAIIATDQHTKSIGLLRLTIHRSMQDKLAICIRQNKFSIIWCVCEF